MHKNYQPKRSPRQHYKRLCTSKSPLKTPKRAQIMATMKHRTPKTPKTPSSY